MIKKRHQHILI